jgi:hypothetical protein
MPQVCRFFGIIIFQNYNDHAPPHFHATYQDFEVLLRIDTLEVYRGHFPPQQLRMLQEWAAAHKSELAENWGRCAVMIEPRDIAPLAKK